MQVSKLVCISALVYILMMCATFTLGAKSKYDENDVFVHNMQLYVGSKQFFVKGISYSPEPLGRPKEGGFCSKKVNYQGVMYGACINEYYFDGVNSNNAYNAKPNGPWFNDIWERDLPVIKELGANTVRVYHMDYITQALIQKYPEYRQKYIQDYAATHKPFMDVAEKHGLKVIVPIVAEEAVLTSFTEAELKKFVEGRVDEIGNHPALLMWAVGNELGLYQKADLRKTVNIMMDYIREYTITKWNRAIPVTTTEVDLPESFNLLSTDLKVDIFAFNAGYRDIYMNTLWQPDTTNKFVGWKSIAQSTGKPLIVSEFGSHNADQLASSGRPDWPNQQYKTIVSAMDSGCVGGIFYEYSDETTVGTSRGLVTFTKATDAETGKDSTQAGVFLADNVNRKDLFDILKSGKSGSAFSSYCYTADEWQLAGAARNVLNLDEISPSDPPANPPTPGNSEVDGQPDDGTSASSSPFSFAMYILIVIASFAILGYTRM